MDAAVVGVLAALGCGLTGLAVPVVVTALPGPAGTVGHRPRLRAWAAGLCAASGGVVGAALGARDELVVLLPLVPVGVALALVDAHTHLLPTRLIWPALAGAAGVALVVALVAGDLASFGRAAGAGATTFVVFHALWWWRPDGMGYGDVRLSALVGFALGLLGWATVVLGVYGAFVVFSLAAVGRAVRRRQRAALREALPFGPFLLAGAVAAIAATGHLVGT